MNYHNLKRGTPQEILEAILDDMEEAFIDQNFAKYDMRSNELRAHLAPFLIAPEEIDWTKYGFSGHESRVANLLHTKLGRAVSKNHLLDSLYFDNPDDQPAPKILDVFICRIRAKLKAAGNPFRVETAWGVGYRMEIGGSAEQASGKYWLRAPRAIAA